MGIFPYAICLQAKVPICQGNDIWEQSHMMFIWDKCYPILQNIWDLQVSSVAKATEKEWYQTEGGSELLKEEFIAKLGRYGEGPDIRKVMYVNFLPPEETSKASIILIKACKKVKESRVKYQYITTRYKEIMHSLKMRKEKLVHITIIQDTSNQS